MRIVPGICISRKLSYYGMLISELRTLFLAEASLQDCRSPCRLTNLFMMSGVMSLKSLQVVVKRKQVMLGYKIM